VAGRYAGIHRDDGRVPLVVDTTSTPGAADDAFVPRLVAAPPPAERWVVHDKFGRGKVLREHEGRLEIAFDDHGTRTLLARFVRDA
jgi:hypothetical protein